MIVGLMIVVVVGSGCSQDPQGTPTLQPTRPSNATPTPVAAEVAKAAVAELFQQQVTAIQQDDWTAVFDTCSPAFRASREIDRYIEDATFRFRQDGYSLPGFEARNVEPSLRAPDRVRVRWDAYQNGQFVRTEEIGQVYVFTQDRWFDDGAWCK